MDKEQRDKLVYTAEVCEQAGMFDEMVKSIKEIVRAGVVLNEEERNLLASAYKSLTAGPRNSIRIITSFFEKERNEETRDAIRRLREAVEEELNKICLDLINTVKGSVLPHVQDPEQRVFYYKMIADYYRYMCEHSKSSAVRNSSREYYEKALALAKETLGDSDPSRLGLALNYSVFMFDIQQEREKACELATSAFERGVKKVDELSEDSYKDSTIILQLLRDNLSMWKDDDDDTSFGYDD